MNGIYFDEIKNTLVPSFIEIDENFDLADQTFKDVGTKTASEYNDVYSLKLYVKTSLAWL